MFQKLHKNPKYSFLAAVFSDATERLELGKLIAVAVKSSTLFPAVTISSQRFRP